MDRTNRLFKKIRKLIKKEKLNLDTKTLLKLSLRIVKS